jgi:cytochrome c oxidase assembly protein subunit 11
MAMTPRFEPSSASRRGSRLIAAGTVGAVVAMLCLSFAAVPLYRLFCAKTGYAGTPQLAKAAPVLRGKRTLVVRFDTNVGRGLAWDFVPDVSQITLQTGQTATVFFKLTNRTDHETVARAAYNIAPSVAGGYFDKLKCFCFSEQRLGPHETADMPVVFFLDPALEKDETMNGIDMMTLSYTLYSADRSKAALGQQQGPAKPALSDL